MHSRPRCVVCKCITEFGRGGACVPARVAPQGRIHRSFLAHNVCILRVGRLVSFGWIVRKWLFCLCGIVWKNMMEIGRGGACVPARVALQGRIHHLPPHAQCVYFWYGNAAVRTFGRAHRHRPYGFVWADYAWVVLFVCWENGAHEPTPSVLYF